MAAKKQQVQRGIEITGYRGPGTQGRYMPPGAYVVGPKLDIPAKVVPQSLAEYLLGIDMATEIAVKATPEVKLVKAEPDEEFQEALDQIAQDEQQGQAADVAADEAEPKKEARDGSK